METKVEYINLEPNWEQVALMFADSLRTKTSASEVCALVETVAYLAQTDLAAVKRLVAYLERGAK